MAKIVSTKMLGLTSLKKKLYKAPLALRKEVAGLMEGAAETVRDDVRNQIRNEPKTGRWYTRRGIRYQASAPGQAPAYATGALFKTIGIKKSSGTKPNARLIADGVYRLMELGTRLMRPRPAFVPAFKRNAKAIIDKVERKSRDVFKKVARG